MDGECSVGTNKNEQHKRWHSPSAEADPKLNERKTAGIHKQNKHQTRAP